MKADLTLLEVADYIAFIDFEASCLGDHTFPTEVGWAIVSKTGQVKSGAYLIQPIPKWLCRQNNWNLESERLTGISKHMIINEGLPCAEVVSLLSTEIEGRLLLSDNPQADGYWFAMLLSASGVKFTEKEIMDVEIAYKYAREALSIQPNLNNKPMIDACIRHRAEPDARRMAFMWGSLAGIGI